MSAVMQHGRHRKTLALLQSQCHSNNTSDESRGAVDLRTLELGGASEKPSLANQGRVSREITQTHKKKQNRTKRCKIGQKRLPAVQIAQKDALLCISGLKPGSLQTEALTGEPEPPRATANHNPNHPEPPRTTTRTTPNHNPNHPEPPPEPPRTTTRTTPNHREPQPEPPRTTPNHREPQPEPPRTTANHNPNHPEPPPT